MVTIHTIHSPYTGGFLHFLKDMPNLSPELLHLVSIFAFTAKNVSEKFLRYLPFVLEKQSLGLTYLAFLYISWKPVHAWGYKWCFSGVEKEPCCIRERPLMTPILGWVGGSKMTPKIWHYRLKKVWHGR